jgi:prolipoprotein diacylglyceryltransferase
MRSNIGQGNALGLGNVGNFANSYFWGSNDESSNNAYTMLFTNGTSFGAYKANTYNVRAVRAF